MAKWTGRGGGAGVWRGGARFHTALCPVMPAARSPPCPRALLPLTRHSALPAQKGASIGGLQTEPDPEEEDQGIPLGGSLGNEKGRGDYFRTPKKACSRWQAGTLLGVEKNQCSQDPECLRGCTAWGGG